VIIARALSELKSLRYLLIVPFVEVGIMNPLATQTPSLTSRLAQLTLAFDPSSKSQHHLFTEPFENILTMSEPASVSKFKAERSSLLSFLEQQARLIRQQPEQTTINEVKINLGEHVPEHLRRVTEAAVDMASAARYHSYVTMKPPGFYDVAVPMMCAALEKRMPFMAERIGLNGKCDMCIHFIIKNILNDIGF
jgi:hypothetical protein